ncbi:Receptor protein serine/threonine kinase, partial [Caligus rogercresseyi]
NKTNPYFHREEVPSSDLITDSQGRLLISGCSACFTLWSSSPEGSRTLLGQGCWSSQENCLESSCNDYSVDGMAANKAKFCCCSAQLCNAHILPPLREGSPKKEEQEVLPSSQNTLN